MKWYVFDEADCFCEFDTAAQAAEYAESMARHGFQGIEIKYTSTEDFEKYCKEG